jgi:hypothetical protein
MLPGDNKYKEYFIDTLFYDSTSTACSIDTATNILTINPSGEYLSKLVAKTINYGYFTMDVFNVSGGPLTYYISYDNKSSWIPVINGTLQNFTGTTTDIYYKIINSGTTATIVPTIDTFGVFQRPAIQISFS